MQLNAPTGQYDPDRLVNIGTNRWSLKAETGMSKTIARWFFELALAGTWFQTNDEFFGGKTREQDPLYSFQIHAVRHFGSGVWFALDWTNYRGGATTTDGVVNDNSQSNGRFGVTLSLPVARRHTVRFSASSGVFTRTGSDFDSARVSWTYRWGAGL